VRPQEIDEENLNEEGVVIEAPTHQGGVDGGNTQDKGKQPMHTPSTQAPQTTPQATPHAKSPTPFQEQGESSQSQEDEDDGPIQREGQVPHPRIHQLVQRDHPVDNILGSIQRGVMTRSRIANFCEFYSFVSSLEPLKVEDALSDLDWVMAMQE